MNRRYILVNKRRFIVIVAMALMIISTLIFSASAQGFKEINYITVKIQKGDTLWSIAEKYGGNSDIRKYIFEIKKANNLLNSQIYEGDELKIPVY
ncbi:MAG TPA: LysM peptidoglycan-binding domain-containing protein [Clostridiaceae bacterium]|nr:LysM peptidoglycan-binding domain-containing protein [Clostridiaceae bacterium]